MGNIHAKLKTTSESMIGAIVVVLNLIRLVKQHVPTFLATYFNKLSFFSKIKIGIERDFLSEPYLFFKF